MSTKCSVCKKEDATLDHAVLLHQGSEALSIDVPVCKGCEEDYQLLSQLLKLFMLFFSLVLSTIMLFMAWGYHHSGESITALLFAMSIVPIGFAGNRWSKQMLKKSHFMRMSYEYPAVVARVHDGYR